MSEMKLQMPGSSRPADVGSNTFATRSNVAKALQARSTQHAASSLHPHVSLVRFHRGTSSRTHQGLGPHLCGVWLHDFTYANEICFTRVRLKYGLGYNGSA